MTEPQLDLEEEHDLLYAVLSRFETQWEQCRSAQATNIGRAPRGSPSGQSAPRRYSHP
jgi:hypothetical protein